MNVDQAANLTNSFGLAAERCLERRPLPGGRFEMLAVPAIVCAAFSIELGLKTLILLRGGVQKGHDLKTLFLRTHAEDQRTIEESLGMDRDALLRSLSKAASAFNDWRYVFEQDAAHADPAFLQAMGGAIRDAIDARRQ